MQRREVMKLGAATVLATMAGSLVGCDKKTLAQWAGTIISAFEQALPILSALVPSSADAITKAIEIAKALKVSLNSGSENAIEFLNQLIAPGGLFQQILIIVGTVGGPQQAIISGILALAGIALNLIATALSQGTPGAPPALVERVRARNVIGANVIETAAKSGALEKALAALKN